MRVYLAVICPSRPQPGELDLAYEVGSHIGRRGAVLVCGGGGGAMEAACRGAREAGGLTLGVLPGATRADANPFVDIAVPTGMGEARNAIVVRTADAVIAVGGGFGTLSEIGLALKMQRPVIGLRTWKVAAPGDPAPLPGIRTAATPEEAVALALEAIPLLGESQH